MNITLYLNLIQYSYFCLIKLNIYKRLYCHAKINDYGLIL